MRKFKRQTSVTLALLLLLTLLPVLPAAVAATEGDYTYELAEEGYVIITAYGGEETSVVVPGTLGGYPVFGIDEATFYGNGWITDITIPDEVIAIGDYVFAECVALESISLGSGIAYIGTDAFSGCISLTEITLPDGLTGINDWTFWNCTSLKSVTIPDSVEFLGKGAFSNCKGMTDITIGSGVASVDMWAFYGSINLTGITVSPDNDVLSDENGVLYNKDKTILIAYPPGKPGSLVLPAGVTTVYEDALSYCPKLTEIDADAANPSFAGIDGVLFNKDKTTLVAFPAGRLGKYTAPAGVTAIAEMAFDGCAGLIEVILPDGLSTIGAEAFYGCDNLANISIPNSVTSIESDAFFNCDNLTITCYSGSYAHTYAASNGIPVNLLYSNHSITFNNGSGSGSWKTLTKKQGDTVTITKSCAKAFTRSGYLFAYFLGSDGNKYYQGDKITVAGDLELTAKYTKVSAPSSAVKSLKLTSAKTKQLTVSYSKVSGANGYRIEYSTSSKFTKSTTKTKYTTKTSLTLTGLTAKKKYYVRVTAYKVDSTNAKIYSKKTATKNLTIK